MKKDLMTRDLERHARVQSVVAEFIRETQAQYDSYAYPVGYLESLLVQMLTYNVSERVRQQNLEQLIQAADKARAVNNDKADARVARALATVA
jgi:hypothetical protein